MDYGDNVYYEIYVDNLQEVSDEDIEKIIAFSEVPENDIEKFVDFVKQHQANPNLDRGYVATPEQIQELKYLHAYNATIMQELLKMAVYFSQSKGIEIIRVFHDPEFKNQVEKFLAELSESQEKQTKFSADNILSGGKRIAEDIISNF